MTDRIKTIRLAGMRQYGFGPEAMKQIKVCNRCGTAVSVFCSYCLQCGEKLPAENLYQAYKRRSFSCPICDTVVSIRAEYCPKCGMKLNSKHK